MLSNVNGGLSCRRCHHLSAEHFLRWSRPGQSTLPVTYLPVLQHGHCPAEQLLPPGSWRGTAGSSSLAALAMLTPAELSAAKWEQLMAWRAGRTPQKIWGSASVSYQTKPLNSSRLHSGAGEVAPEGLLLQEAAKGESLHTGFSPTSC